MSLVTMLVAAGWLALAALIVWSVLQALRGALADDSPPALFAALERRRLAPAAFAERIGMEALALAVRRCVLCPRKAACRAGEPVDCPNAALFQRSTTRGVTP
jgi:hypothetical protein